jgi:conjugal transfer pilus assembly protein TraW
MKPLLLWLAATLIAFSGGHIKQIGQTWNFAERDFLDEIRDRINDNAKAIEERLSAAQKEAREKIDRFKPADLPVLPNAKADRSFFVDMTYTLDRDIKGADGNVIYPKGFQFSPSDYLNLPYEIIVLNGDSEAQLRWFEDRNSSIASKILLADGEYKAVSKRLKRNVFYATTAIVKRFEIKATPSIVRQIGNAISVREICIECKERQ